MTGATTGARLRPGDIVRVRSQAEVLATLDSEGRLDRLPFMPEMLRYCGRTIRVFRRADTTCNSMSAPPGVYGMREAVFLWGARCDGSGHGGCDAGCLLFWKEAWLARPTSEDGSPRADDWGAVGSSVGQDVDVAVETLTRAAAAPAGAAAGVWACQATALGEATTPLPRVPWWDVRQYAADLRSGNASIARVADSLARHLAASLRFRLGRLPIVRAVRSSTDRAQRGGEHAPLVAGDRVRVRTRSEIESTLDARSRLRGLTFYAEMQRYGGREFRVLRPVTRIVSEETGRLTELKDAYILDGVVCEGEFHRLCPRAAYPYWRGAWLQKLD